MHAKNRRKYIRENAGHFLYTNFVQIRIFAKVTKKYLMIRTFSFPLYSHAPEIAFDIAHF